MTIRLLGTTKNLAVDDEFGHVGEYVVRSQYGDGTRLASADTREEAEQAKRALELVLAPRFTRDEAIAIVKDALNPSLPKTGRKCIPDAMRKGARLALEALADAGVFSDGRNMSDKLDAAGIK